MSESSVTSLPLLPDIDELRPFGPEDQACFDELRAVLERHGALGRFGLTLLHRHFDVADDEVMVEFIDADTRTQIFRPRPIAEVGGGIETSWRLDDPRAQRRCETQCIPDRDSQGNPVPSPPALHHELTEGWAPELHWLPPYSAERPWTCHRRMSTPY